MSGDSAYLVEQSGVIPYRKQNKQIRVLLITSRHSRRWIVPKGTVEPDLSPAESAEKEAYEEAGIHGTVHGSAVGEYTYEKWGESYRVQLFLMEVTQEFSDWEESHFRERRWVSLSKARDLVDISILKQIFADFQNHLT